MTTTNAEKLMHQFHRCMNLMHRGRPHRGHGGRDAHRGQGRLLSLLKEKSGISQRELAEILHIRPPSLSEILSKLENSGFIERREHEEDRRMSNVFITEKGRTTAEQVEEIHRNAKNELFSVLSQKEQETLSGLLETLIASLEAQAVTVVEHRARPCECPHGHHREGMGYCAEEGGHPHGRHHGKHHKRGGRGF